MRTQTKVSLCAPSTVDLWKIPRQWRAKMPECTEGGGHSRWTYEADANQPASIHAYRHKVVCFLI